jgi:transposase-like protein
MRENALHQWIQSQNSTKGVAPVSAMVLQAFKRLDTTVEPSATADTANQTDGHEPSACPTTGSETKVPRGTLQWLRRWRRRWSTRLGRFAPREHMEVADMQFKDSIATQT